MFNNLRGLAQKSKILLMVLAILLFLVNIAVFLPEEKKARINTHDLMGDIEFHTSNNQSFPETKNITLDQEPEAVNQVSSPEDYGNSVLTTFGFEKYPFLPSNQTVSCIPYSFGYSDEQARRFFDPNKKFGSCKTNNEQFLFYTDNNLEINKCQGSKDYVLGTVPGKEELGAVSYKINWIPYKQPVDTGSSEFFYGKCGNRKQTFLINKRKEEAAQRARNITEQLSKNLETQPKPLSVFLVVFDSVSRLHFYRNFPSTVQSLNEKLVDGEYSKDYVGYDFVITNVHGENTLPNMVPLFFGHSLSEHQKITKGLNYKNSKSNPEFEKIQERSMWKFYEKMGFVTAFGYDTTWDYLVKATGRKIKADHVATNFWKGAQKVFGVKDNTEKQRCLGRYDSHWYMLDYLKQFTQNYKGLNKFGYVHLSPGHEDTGTVIKTADPDIKEFIESMFRTHKENNEDLVLMIASDHGKHTKEWDQTIEGYVENQLAFHFVFANQDLIRRMGPETDSILKHNSKRLNGRLDWYLSFKHLAFLPYGNLNALSPVYDDWKNSLVTPHAHSMFLEYSPDDRTCDQLDILSYLCTCMEYKIIPITEAVKIDAVHVLAELGINSINRRIALDKAQDFCQEVSLKEILSVKEQQLKHDEFQNRNLKVRVSIHENPNAVFEFFGFMAEAEKEFKKWQKPENDGENPIQKVEFISGTATHKMKIQLREIVRIDTYKGLCEVLAKSQNTQAPKCICKTPQEFNITSEKLALQAAYTQLKARLRIEVGQKGETCDKVCGRSNQVCEEWGLQLLNNFETLSEPWLSENSYLLNSGNSSFTFKSLQVSQVSQGALLGLGETKLYVSQNTQCDVSNAQIRPICSCS